MNRFQYMMIFLIIVVLVLDVLTYLSVKQMAGYSGWNIQHKLFRNIFFILPLLVVSGIGVLSLIKPDQPSASLYYFYMLVFTVIIIFYFPKIIYLLGFGIDFITMKIKSWIFGGNVHRFILAKGLGILSLLLMLTLLYGHVWGRFQFRTVTERVGFENLPAAFDNFKIVQISDFHIGSFYYHKRQVQRVVDKINRLDPDIIVFTGDYVNNFAEEADKFTPLLKRLKAKYGKFGVLGNHDYGEYYPWPDVVAMKQNLERTRELYKASGFVLLDNRAEKIIIGTDSIRVVGVDNWGLPPFPQFGDLEKALSGIPGDAFKILLSHDPTHWDEEVIPGSNIDLTLSGHTHGMQYGIKNKRIRWSPVALKYPKWGGLYTSGKQKMHVSVGVGNIGYLGRFGMWPEINMLQIQKN